MIASLVLATFITFHGAGWSNGASSAGLVRTGDANLSHFLTSEIDHAGA